MSTTSAARRRPTQARAEETRRRILNVAREIFAARGFDGANVRDIAAAAEASHAMIRYHFGTKDKLWREAVKQMFELNSQEVFSAEIVEDPIDQFRQLTHRYALYCARHPEHARISISEAIKGGERLNWMVEEFVRQSHGKVIPLMDKLMEIGAVPRVPMPSMIYSYVGMLQLPFALAKEAEALGYDMASEKAVALHADAVLKIILN